MNIFPESIFIIISGWLLNCSHYIGVLSLIFSLSFYYFITDGKKRYSGVKNEKLYPSLPPHSVSLISSQVFSEERLQLTTCTN